MILTIINALSSATNLPIKPNYTDTIENCIVYNVYPQMDDGATQLTRLELRLITDTMANGEIFRKKIIQALVPVGDNKPFTDIYKCELNGGGMMYDDATNTVHTLLYFDIITRSENI